MRRVILGESEIETSVLGLGCSKIMGSVDKNTSLKALRLALDHGITHFDVARSYGFGDAERLVGSFLKGERHRVTLASKFGIVPDWKVKYLKPLKPLVRALKRVTHTQKNHSPNKIAVDLNKRVHIDRNFLFKSLDKSLEAFKTDYLDVFMVHDPLETLTGIDEILLGLDIAKRNGKIRLNGIAIDKESFISHREYLKYFDIVQMNFDIEKRDFVTDSSCIHFGVSSNDFIIGNVENKLAYLNEKYPNDLILMSMFNEDHLIQNTKLFL